MNKSNSNIRHSQNFLHSNDLVSQLIQKSNIGGGDIVYEIGPGKGIITKGLAAKGKKVISIEFDPKMAQTLKEQFFAVPNVEIIYADFLRYELPSGISYKFFSNIPFNITADIMTKVLELGGIQDIYFVMQYEAFLKYAGSPHYRDCLKSLLYKPFYDMKIVHQFVPTDFKPTPKAKIVFAHICPKRKPNVAPKDQTKYRDFLSYLFAEHGKSLKDKAKKLFSYEQLKRISKGISFPMEHALSELKFEQWLMLFDAYLRFVPEGKKAVAAGGYKRLLKEQAKLEKLHRNRNTQREKQSSKAPL